jgi:hypothetical protein
VILPDIDDDEDEVAADPPASPLLSAPAPTPELPAGEAPQPAVAQTAPIAEEAANG